MKLITAVLLSVFVFLGAYIPVNAQTLDASSSARNDGSLTVSPAYVEITLSKPDEKQTIPLQFTNNSNTPITLEMFPINFNHADANGTIGFLSQESGSYSYSLASYLSLESNQLQIDPKKSATFSVLVQNRPDLTPGGHYGAIVAKVVSGNGQNGAQVSPSLSSLIFLKKTGGERYNLSLKQTGEEGSFAITYPEQVFLEFQNEGNVHLVPYGTVEITDLFGRVIKQGTLNTSSFLVMPESRRDMTVTLRSVKQSFPISFNTITVRGNDSLKKTTFLYRNSSFYINPYFLISLMVLFILVMYLRKRKKASSIIIEQRTNKKPTRQSK